MACRLGDGGALIRFLSPPDVYSPSDNQPASFSVVTGDIFLGINLPGREADLSLPFSAAINNAWSYTSSHYIPNWQIEGQLYVLPSQENNTAVTLS